MDAASAVVCHGGPGTIALARRCGHVPIVVPRDPALGEHVDDHQMRYTAVLARSGAIEIATSAAELGRLLSTPRPRHVSEADSASGRRRRSSRRWSISCWTTASRGGHGGSD